MFLGKTVNFKAKIYFKKKQEFSESVRKTEKRTFVEPNIKVAFRKH